MTQYISVIARVRFAMRQLLSHAFRTVSGTVSRGAVQCLSSLHQSAARRLYRCDIADSLGLYVSYIHRYITVLI